MEYHKSRHLNEEACLVSENSIFETNSGFLFVEKPTLCSETKFELFVFQRTKKRYKIDERIAQKDLDRKIHEYMRGLGIQE